MQERCFECEECGVTYFTTATNSKYCSLECQDKAHKRKAKEWKEKHPNFYKEYQREYRKRKKMC